MSFENSPPPSRARVPPPPPPGFGDEEYYRLYGRPEEYHKYRERLERDSRDTRGPIQPERPPPPGPPSYLHDGPPGRPRRRAPPPPGHDHEEYYYYRSYRRSPHHNRDYEDPEFEYYSPNGVGGNKVRRAPPPPPPPQVHRNEESPIYASEESTDYGDDVEGSTPRRHDGHRNSDESGRDFENFRVTIKNAHNRGKQLNSDGILRRGKGRGRSLDGTPSLSGVDDDIEEDDENEDSYYDDSNEEEDSEEAEDRERRQRHRRGGGGADGDIEEPPSPLPQPDVRKKGSIKDRLGHRVPVRPPSPPDPPPKRQRIAPPLSPPYPKRISPSSPEIRLRKRPPSPLSPPPEYRRDEDIEESEEDTKGKQPRRRGVPDKRKLSKRISEIRRTSPSAKSSNRRRHQQLGLSSKRESRSPRRNRVNHGNGRQARSWSKGKEDKTMGSRYGNRSPTPLPGTPRRVKERRAREAAGKKAAEDKDSKKDKSRKNNPITGKSKMRMDREAKQKRSKDRSSDETDENNDERPRSRLQSTIGSKDRRRERRKSGESRSPPRRDRRESERDRTRSRTSSGGFGKGVIGKNLRKRNVSGANRPPTPVPIGSRSRNKKSRKNRERQTRKKDDKGSAKKIGNQNTDKTSKENEVMLRRLARKRKGVPQPTDSDKNRTLAKMAGLEIPPGTSGLESPKEEVSQKNKDEKEQSDSEKSELSSRGSGSGSNNDCSSRSVSGSPHRRGRKREWKSNSGKDEKYANTRKKKAGGKPGDKKSRKSHRSKSSESASREGRSRSKGAKTPPSSHKKSKASSGKWVHDKFQDTLASPVNDRTGSGGHKIDDRDDFGSHWQKIRSERSKERDRAGRSRSRSKSKRGSRNKRGRSSSYNSDSSTDSRRRKSRGSKRSRSHSGSTSRSSSSYTSSSTGSIHRERRKERKKISHKDRLKISTENSSVAQAATRASQAITNRQVSETHQGNSGLATGDDGGNTQAATNANNDNDQVNMGLSGKLVEETNMVNGVVVKYSEPPEARKPRTRWRLYVFKGSEELPILYIHRQSAYLLGRDRKVADIPLDHPSCSKQHAALQFRLVDFTRPDGIKSRRVTPYVIDLNSANGTFVNNQKIEGQRYVQLMEKDVLKFGFSSREYVMLHDQSKEEQEEDPGLE